MGTHPYRARLFRVLAAAAAILLPGTLGAESTLQIARDYQPGETYTYQVELETRGGAS